MTTISYRDGIMASDTGCSGGMSHPWAHKMARGPDGVLHGVSGSADEAHQYLEWVEGGYRGEAPKAEPLPDSRSSFIVLIAAPGKPLRIRTSRGEEIVKGAPYLAIGAGAEAAMGAMWSGASAPDSIRAAMVHGDSTWGDIRVIAHDPGG